MDEVRRALLQHLEAAVEAYGADLPLAPGEAIAQPPAPAEPAPVQAAATLPGEVATPPAPTGAPPDEAVASPAAAGPDPASVLAALASQVASCTRCKLHQGRQNVVFGEGNPAARVMFVGEAPGAVEDRTGRPFVGPAGQLLDRILGNAMGLRRDDVYIGNVNKCRPPNNRDPEPDEVAACLPYLRAQVAAIRPSVIVCLGRVAAHNLLGTAAPLRALRGRDLRYEGIPVVVTYHPAALLRDPGLKRDTWEDIKRVNRLLGVPEVPPREAGA